MYARITRLKIKQEALAGVVESLPKIREATSKISGGVANYVVWNDDGAGAAIAIYENADFAEAASDQIEAIWAGMAEALAEPPVFEAYAHADSLR